MVKSDISLADLEVALQMADGLKQMRLQIMNNVSENPKIFAFDRKQAEADYDEVRNDFNLINLARAQKYEEILKTLKL
jgi:hypothetical protein